MSKKRRKTSMLDGHLLCVSGTNLHLERAGLDLLYPPPPTVLISHSQTCSCLTVFGVRGREDHDPRDTDRLTDSE